LLVERVDFVPGDKGAYRIGAPTVEHNQMRILTVRVGADVAHGQVVDGCVEVRKVGD
jgi:hypothetical protein